VFKRIRWIGAGAAIGAGSVVWLQRKLRLVAEKYGPEGRVAGAVDRAMSFPADVRDAFTEGRAAMREREAELTRTHLRRNRRSRHR
jgi:hypothetical protein